MDGITIIWSIVSFFLLTALGLVVWFGKSFITRTQNNDDISRATDVKLAKESAKINQNLNESILRLTFLLEKQQITCDSRMAPIESKLENHDKMLMKHDKQIGKILTK
jgi:hypothetical protein